MLVMTMYLVVTTPTRTRLRFKMGNNLGVSGLDFSGSTFGKSGGANFFINPVTRFALPVVKVKTSITTLCSRASLKISKRGAVGLGAFTIPIGLG